MHYMYIYLSKHTLVYKQQLMSETDFVAAAHLPLWMWEPVHEVTLALGLTEDQVVLMGCLIMAIPLGEYVHSSDTYMWTGLLIHIKDRGTDGPSERPLHTTVAIIAVQHIYTNWCTILLAPQRAHALT